MWLRRLTSILPTQHPTIGTTFTTDCRSTKHLDHIPDPVTTLGFIGEGGCHECSVRDYFHDIRSNCSSPFNDWRSATTLHMECIEQRSNWPFPPSADDHVGRY